MAIELNHTIVHAGAALASAASLCEILGRSAPVIARIRGRGLDHWADPGRSRPDQINHNDGGRGVYWDDGDGHLFEIITRAYSSGA